MPINFSLPNLPAIKTWPHDEAWNPQDYAHYLSMFLAERPEALARWSLTPATASDIHSDEWSLALQHALGLALLDEVSPF